MGKILILGASSYVGQHLRRHIDPAETVSTYNANAIDGGVRFDVTTMSVSEVLDAYEGIADAVILLGDTQPDSCFADPKRSRAVNVDGVKHVLDDLVGCSVRPIFASSEFVFDGRHGDYGEEDTANPVLLYGEQKLEVERHLESITEDFAILRLAKIYGVEPGDGTLFTGMFEAVRNAGTMRCAADQRFSPVYVGDVIDALVAAVRQPLRGTYHVAGPQGFSRMELLETVIAEARAHGPVDVEIEPCSINDFDLPEARPLDVSLRPDKLLAATGLDFMTPAAACREIWSRRVAIPPSAENGAA